MMGQLLKSKVALVAEATRAAGRGIAVELGAAGAHLAGDPKVARWNGQSLSSGQLAKVYGFTDLDGSKPDCWRCFPDIHDAGKSADATGDR